MNIDPEVASCPPEAPSKVEEIKVNSVAAFVAKLAKLDREKGTETFYRGHADEGWKLEPSILRTEYGPEKEHLLFRDMVAHEPQSFSECRSALDHLVQMQHYGLPTRLLDVTMNPLVALYFACEEDTPRPANGAVFVFSVPEGKVKHYDSDTVSVLANLAKCASKDLSICVYPDRDSEGSFYDGLTHELPSAVLENYRMHEALCIGEFMLSPYCLQPFPDASNIQNEYLAKLVASGEPLSLAYFRSKDPYKDADPWVGKLWQDILYRSSWPKWEDSYQKWLNNQDAIAILLHQIREEKPHFQPLVHPYDLVSIFLVKAKYDNQRITNQSGAFLLFGLGLDSHQEKDGSWGPLYCDKGKLAKVPDGWIMRKFIVSKRKKKAIRKELENLGITDSYIYPGIEQYAKELKQRYSL
ncbi:FRG domain-containing protein [Porphyromonas sp.]